MVANAQKVPLAQSIGLAGKQQAANRVARTGKVLPCSVASVNGSIVTVNFEMNADPHTLPQVQMPVFGPEYIRYPLQPGDKGIAVSADVYIGQMSGLGDGVADWREPPNLGALVFLPVGNTGFSSADGQVLTLYGPNGVTLKDANNKVTFTLMPSGISIDLHNNGNVNILNGGLYVQGTIVGGMGANQVSLLTHRHTQPNDSHGDTEAATNAPIAGSRLAAVYFAPPRSRVGPQPPGS